MKAAALRASATNRSKLTDWKGTEPTWVERNSPEVDGQLAEAHDGLAETCNQLDQLPCAKGHYESPVRAESARPAGRPHDTPLTMVVSHHLIDLGWIKHRPGRQRDAIAYEERALALQVQIGAEEPQNIMARVDKAKTLITTGFVYWDGGDLGNSARCLQRAVSILELMLGRDPGDQSTLSHLTWANAELGEVFIRRAKNAHPTDARATALWIVDFLRERIIWKNGLAQVVVCIRDIHKIRPLRSQNIEPN
jgi:hypothetical protein